MANLFGVDVFAAVRRAAGGLALAALPCAPAYAGDVAELNILGFTADGSVFAFEQYGVQDGSGFPYADRFYIDTAADKFLPGTPIRVTLEDENATVAAARDEARRRGEKIAPQAVLEENRGFTAAFNAVTEESADPTRILAYPLPILPSMTPALEFRLEQFPVKTAYDRCFDLAELKGFKLIQVGTQDGGATEKVLHADTSVPESRGCAYGYRLGGLQTFGRNYLNAYAVLISVQSLGFETPDYRWIAVTGRL